MFSSQRLVFRFPTHGSHLRLPSFRQRGRDHPIGLLAVKKPTEKQPKHGKNPTKIITVKYEERYVTYFLGRNE